MYFNPKLLKEYRFFPIFSNLTHALLCKTLPFIMLTITIYENSDKIIEKFLRNNDSVNPDTLQSAFSFDPKVQIVLN